MGRVHQRHTSRSPSSTRFPLERSTGYSPLSAWMRVVYRDITSGRSCSPSNRQASICTSESESYSDNKNNIFTSDPDSHSDNKNSICTSEPERYSDNEDGIVHLSLNPAVTTRAASCF